MTLNRVLITAVVVENRSVAEVAACYGVSRSWLYELLARYRREGEAAFEARSRRPQTFPTAIPAATKKAVTMAVVAHGREMPAASMRSATGSRK